MNRHFLPLSLGIAGIALVLAAFGTDNGDTAPADDADDGVVLGEVDLAEQAEIWRNQYRRMTPGNEPLVQDVGELPAAWEEFSSAWDTAPAVRDLATWLVPFSAERVGPVTVLRDSDGTVLWSGTTDFAKDESASVTLTGSLVDEEEWPLYEAAREEVERRYAEAFREAGRPRLRDGEGGGTNNTPANNPDKMFVSAVADFTIYPPEIRVGLLWTNDVTLDVFAYGPLHTSALCTISYTNDENQLVTTNVLRWYQVEPTLTGRFDNLWKFLGSVALTNGEETVFVDTNYLPERWVVRYYSAFEAGDYDNDGLNDALETRILGTSTNTWDTDDDGVDDFAEFDAGTDATGSNVWWVVMTTNNISYWEYIGSNTTWYTNPVPIYNTNIVGQAPAETRVVRDVKLDGFVDDAIKVNGTFVDFSPGPQTFSDRSLTNVSVLLQEGEFLLSLYDCPSEGHAGHNQACLGETNGPPLRATWEWWVPLDIRLEHINTNGHPLVVNPSGTRTNREFACQVSVLPTNFPESNISWSCTNAGMSFVGGVTNGRTVHLKGTQLGDWEARVTAMDGTNELFSAKLKGTVLEKKRIPIYLHIVRDNDGNNAATTVAAFNTLLGEANQIHEQSAIEFFLATNANVLYTNKTDWLDISTSNDYEEYGQLQSWSSNTGGIEVYCIYRFDNPSTLGLTWTVADSRGGVTITTNATGLILAHELGHACGLEDIYDYRMQQGHLTLFNTNYVQQSWVSHDWCTNLSMGGYGQLPQIQLLRRLLMYGYAIPDAVDISAGPVFGLNVDAVETNCAVGLSNMTRDACSW